MQRSITRALPHRDDKVREEEQLADEENACISLEASTAKGAREDEPGARAE